MPLVVDQASASALVLPDHSVVVASKLPSPLLVVEVLRRSIESTQGFAIERDGGGGFRFFRPDGRELTATGGAPSLPGDPVEALRVQHRTGGIAIDARTSFPRWDGQAPHYEHAVFCLAQQEALTP